MNDLDLVTAVTPHAPLPEPADLAGARRRLTAAIAAERCNSLAPQLISRGAGSRAGVRGRRVPAAWSARRLTLSAAAVAAAAVAAGATVLVIVPSRGPAAPPRTRPPATLPAPGRSAPGLHATVNVAAARFFRHAATVTLQLPANPPGPDQFVYTQTKGASGVNAGRLWLSAEGNRDGLVQNPGQAAAVLPTCTVAQAQVPRKSPPGMLYPRMIHCAEEAGYIPAMPTDPRNLLAYLIKIGVADAPPRPRSPQAASPGWFANDLGKCLDYLMQTTYLLPAQQAALFDLMAQTPGFTVVSGARDAIGRIGVAVRWTYEGAPAEIIFNPVSYAYMGDRTWPAPGFHGPGADAYDGAALVKMAFVNQAGQLP
jgi:hypothetical protein